MTIGVARSDHRSLPPADGSRSLYGGIPRMSTMNEFELAAWSEMAAAGELRTWLVSGRYNNVVKYQRVLRERAEKIRKQ